MDTTTRYILGIVILVGFQILLGGTAIFLIRKRKSFLPSWSWIKAEGAYFLLMLVATALSLIPLVGRWVAVIVALVGFKRLTGLDILMTFIVAFCLGICVLGASYVVSHQLQVDLWALGE